MRRRQAQAPEHGEIHENAHSTLWEADQKRGSARGKEEEKEI